MVDMNIEFGMCGLQLDVKNRVYLILKNSLLSSPNCSISFFKSYCNYNYEILPQLQLQLKINFKNKQQLQLQLLFQKNKVTIIFFQIQLQLQVWNIYFEGKM